MVSNKISEERLRKMAEVLNLKYLTAEGIEALNMDFFDNLEK